jgi:muramoyltetrapeptide carboxypeptidase LdcA involved in peptidoglycan recycling
MQPTANQKAVIRPPRLRPGDTIGIISPSWGGPAVFPHRVEQGLRALQSLGFNVKMAPHASNQHGFVSGTAQNRAADIHEMFADPGVRMILASIGGNHSNHLLPHLDFNLIRQNPKIFMGFSDVTVLNLAIWHTTGLVTFNGPALMTDFGEYPAMLSYTREQFLRMVGSTSPLGVLPASTEWTEEFLDWGQKKDLQRPRQLQPSPPWVWLRPGAAQGPLVGGCLESLDHLKGTRFWPDLQGAILFLETSEEKPSPETVDSMLMDFENMGVFDCITGMLFGRPYGYTAIEKQQFHEVILERTQAYNFPILAEMDFGHTSPQLTLPIGIPARLDSTGQTFSILEPAVTD